MYSGACTAVNLLPTVLPHLCEPQAKRESDPYKDLMLRLLYEATHGGQKAPTFKL